MPAKNICGMEDVMVLVLGGYANGKLEFARENLGVTEWSDGSLDSPCCVYNLQDMAWEDGFLERLEEYVGSNPDAVVICCEVGGGVVPVDARERQYREDVGHACRMLAKRADRVYRVLCGIGKRIA
jgi:adenosylcobinamide kinase/adenosylcobinamide-phosphate guanylyltransferase